MLFVPDLGAGAGDAARLEPDKCYVELYVNSLRLRNARKFTSKFHGIVYTFASLPSGSSEDVKIPGISKPENLAQLDPGGLDRVITVNKQMMGAIPWRGGPFSLELGLFSVKAGNLLTPVVDFMSEISTAAGISFFGKVAPFVPLIVKGMDMLAGQTKDVALEVGLDAALQLEKAGTYAIVAVPKNGAVKREKLSLDVDGKLLHDGAPLKEAYCVFSIRSTDRKNDFGEIPELKEAYAKLRTAIRDGRLDPAEKALAAFRLIALTSPDLIPVDAKRLVVQAETMVKEAFPAGQVSAAGQAMVPAELSKVPLYA